MLTNRERPGKILPGFQREWWCVRVLCRRRGQTCFGSRRSQERVSSDISPSDSFRSRQHSREREPSLLESAPCRWAESEQPALHSPPFSGTDFGTLNRKDPVPKMRMAAAGAQYGRDERSQDVMTSESSHKEDSNTNNS